MKEKNQREIVLDLLLLVEQKQEYSHIVLQRALQKYQYMDKQARGFITKVFEGTIENRICIDYVIDRFSKTATADMRPLIRNLLRLSVFQMLYMDAVPVSAVCNEAVKLAKKRGMAGLGGFVNGVLRGIGRGRDQIAYPDPETDLLAYLSVVYSIPRWILEQWKENYGAGTARSIAEAVHRERPTTIRVNTGKCTVEQCRALLERQGITVEPGDYVDTALKIRGYDYLEQIEGFAEGLFGVQDESSMLVGVMADPQKGARVLDVCAAPGGKALHIADLLKETGIVVARDISPGKIRKIQENLDRFGFRNVELQVQDALEQTEETVGWADIVLADLPCSGLGIIGKKPDIKYNMTSEKQKELAGLQRRILDVSYRYVKPGGLLMYSTCTINPDENERNVEWFVRNYPFRLEERKQLLPGTDTCDGFFIAKLRRE